MASFSIGFKTNASDRRDAHEAENAMEGQPAQNVSMGAKKTARGWATTCRKIRENASKMGWVNLP